MATPLGTFRTGSGMTITALLERYAAKAVPPLGRALYTEGEQIMSASKPLVPVDTGALRASGYVEQPAISEDKVTVELGYGGPAAQQNPKSGESTDGYAIYVHENLEAHHRVGQAHYLSDPFYAAQGGMSERIAQRMKADLEGAGGAA